MNADTGADRRKLGASGLTVSAQGVGTMSWGPSRMWGYGDTHTEEDVRAAFGTCLDAGVDFFDTAEGYGKGESERLLGAVAREDGRPVVLATKFRPRMSRFSADSLLPALQASLERLGTQTVDLYQIHTPVPHIKVEDLMDVMAKAVHSGRIRAVGVSNYSAALMRRAHARLAEHGIPLASNEVHFSLLHRNPERNGVLETCHELDVALIAASPMEMGVLTGKYRTGNARMPLSRRMVMLLTGLDPSGDAKGRKRLTAGARPLRSAAVEPVLDVLEDVADTRGTTPQAIALNWLLSVHELVVPIPGAKNKRQAESNLAALGWRLSGDEFDLISEAAAGF